MARLQDLNDKVEIVNPDRTPTPYLMRLLQERGVLQGDDHELLSDLLLKVIVEGLGINVTNGAFAEPGDIEISADIQELLDSLGMAHGDILYRDSTGWTVLAPGTAGHALVTGGAGANPAWASVAANIQTLLDGISSTRGSVLYRGASAWAALGTSDNGKLLMTQGAGADPVWMPPGAPLRTVVTRTTAQTITTNTFTAVSWSSSPYDDAGGWSSGSPTVITAPFNGKAKVNFHGIWESNSVGVRVLSAELNGNKVVQDIRASLYESAATVSTRWLDVTAGQTIKGLVYHERGSNLNFSPAGGFYAGQATMEVEWSR